MSKHYEQLFTPGKIGNVELRNRIVMAPVTSVYGNEAGASTERHRRYLAARAKGGVGLIVTDNLSVEYPRGAGGLRAMRVDHNRYVAALNQLAEEVQFYGAKIVGQISHAGRQTTLGGTDIEELVSASPIPWDLSDGIPRELTVDEIQDVIKMYVDAALRLEQAKLDGVEIHAAHGYLLSSFLSPAFNVRTDEYGGSTENRARIVEEIIRQVREKTHEDFMIIVRMNARDGVPGGIEPEEAAKYAQLFEKAGADALHVSQGLYETPTLVFPQYLSPEGVLLDGIRTVKAAVDIPVIGVGKIFTPERAEEALVDGDVDFVALGRALVADPEWANKARAGTPEKIRPCIACNYGCIYRINQNLDVQCNVNPYVGREWEISVMPKPAKKRILVVGAGPAGVQFALRADELGHEVLVLEKADQIGGQLAFSQAPPFKSDLGRLITYYKEELADRGIRVELGQEATAESIEGWNPDEIVLATGSVPFVPEGLQNGVPSFTYEDAFRGKADLSGSVLVVGAGQIGCEVAVFAAREFGAEVTLVEREADILHGVDPSHLVKFSEVFTQLPITLRTEVEVTSVASGRAVGVSRNGGGQVELPFDTLIFATGRQPDTRLARVLETNRPVHLIGDCRTAATVLEATRQATLLAESL